MRNTQNKLVRRFRMHGLLCRLILGLTLVFGGMTVRISAQENPEIPLPPHSTIDVFIDSKGQTVTQWTFHYDQNPPQKVSLEIPTFSQKLLNYQVGVRPKGDSEVHLLQETSSGVMGSFQLNQENRTASVDVSYPFTSESDLIIKYELDQLAIKYQDTAFWSGGWILPDLQADDQVDLTFHLDQPLESSEIQAWIHGQNGQINKIETSQAGTQVLLSLVYDPNQAQEVEVDLVFPREALADTSHQVNEERLTAIQDHEDQRLAIYHKQLANDLMQRRLRFAFWLIIPIAGTCLIIYSYRRYARHHLSSLPTIQSLQLPPEDLLATVVNPLVYQKSITDKELTASLLELGRKGYLKPVPVRMTRRSNSQTRSGYTIAISRIEDAPPLTLLQTFERQVYALFTDPNKATVTIEELVYQVKHSKKKKQACESRWIKFINAIHLRIASLSPVKNRSKRRLILACLVWLVISLIFLIILSYEALDLNLSQALPWAITIAILNLFILLGILVMIDRRSFKTSEQAMRQARWQELRRLFERSDQIVMDKYADISQWESLIAYAIVLDASNTIQKSFTHQFDMANLAKVSKSQNADLYRVHGAIADILLPSVREYVAIIQPKRSQFKAFFKDKSNK